MEAIFSQYTAGQWLVLILAAFLTGMAKAGLKGLSMLVVPLMAASFTGRPSTGLLLPLLCIADVFAVRHYHRHADPKYLFRLLPPAMVGVLVATAVGLWVSDQVFTTMIAWTIIGTVVLLIVQESVDLSALVARRPVIGYAFGWLGGFTTMIGNAAGPVMAVYLLATRIPKNNYMGTIAWFFLIINVFKLPWHFFVWRTIDLASLAANLLVLPAIFMGVHAGIAIVARIPERMFRYLVIGMTAIMAAKLLLDGLWS
jgi:uncharacterized protein